MSDQLSALLTPREYLSLHNTSNDRDHVTLSQAFALSMTGRYLELYSAETPLKPILRMGEDISSLNTEWFVVYLLLGGITDGPNEARIASLLEASHDDAVALDIRGVAAIAAAIFCASSGDPNRALRVIREASDVMSVEAGPLLRATLASQRVLRLAEANQYNEAAETAADALGSIASDSENLRRYNDEDVETTAMAALELSLHQTAKSLDRVRSGTLSFQSDLDVDQFPLGVRFWASLDRQAATLLNDVSEEVFRQRVVEPSDTSRREIIGASDKVDREASQAWFTVSLYGDWNRVRRWARQWAMLKLARSAPEDEDEKEHGLALLRMSGSAKDLKQALRTSRTEGPLGPLARAGEGAVARILETDGEFGPTRTDLAIAQYASDLLSVELVDRSIQHLLQTTNVHTKRDWLGFYRYDHLLWDALESLSERASESRPELIRTILSFADHADGITVRSLARIATSIDLLDVGGDVRQTLMEWSLNHLEGETKTLASGVLYRFAVDGREEAIQALIADWRSTRRLNQAAELTNLAARDASVLSVDIVDEILSVCLTSLQRTREEAAGGAFGFGGVDAAVVATVLSATYPKRARWREIVDYLLDANVAVVHKEESLDWLARDPSILPDDEVYRIAESLSQAFAGPQDSLAIGGAQGASLRFACSTGSITAEYAGSLFLDLVGNADAGRRLQAARSAPFVANVYSPDLVGGILLGLRRDSSLVVQAAAARRVPAVISKTNGAVRGSLVEFLLESLRRDGISVPLATLRGLHENSNVLPIEVQDRLSGEVSRLSSGSSSELIRGAASDVLTYKQ